jgi:hypothetical protein
VGASELEEPGGSFGSRTRTGRANTDEQSPDIQTAVGILKQDPSDNTQLPLEEVKIAHKEKYNRLRKWRRPINPGKDPLAQSRAEAVTQILALKFL